MMKRNNLAIFLLCSLALLLTACASKEPSFGELVQAEGKDVAKIGKNWEEGKSLIAKGKKRVKKGNAQIKEGNKNVAEGKMMILKGETLVAESEARYNEINSN